MDRMESEVLEEKLDDLRKKLSQTIAQIQLLENQIRDFSNRKRRAHNQRKHSVNNRMKFRLMTSAGVKRMYKQYLSIKAEEVRVLEHTLSAIGRNPNPQQQQPLAGINIMADL